MIALWTEARAMAAGGCTTNVRIGLRNLMAVYVLALILAACVCGEEIVERHVIHIEGVDNSVETQNVRMKLTTAEESVKRLVTKLGAVSEDASRARLEIHETLLEAWTMVDVLGKDRCGDAVLEVRRKQQEAQDKVDQLQAEIALKAETVGTSKSTVDQLTTEVASIKSSFESEKSQRLQLDAELMDVKDRLTFAISLTNRSDSYGAMEIHLKQLAVQIGERTEKLKITLQYLKEDLDIEESFETLLSDMRSTVLNTAGDYSTISSLKLDAAQVLGFEKKQIDAERQLTQVLQRREDAVRTAENLHKRLEAMRAEGAVTRSTNSGGSSIFVTLVLMLVSIVFGALLVLMSGRNSPEYGDSAFSPLSGRPGSSFTPSSAGATPHPRRMSGNRSTPGDGVAGLDSQGNSGPREYYRTDGSPLTYARQSASPTYRNY